MWHKSRLLIVALLTTVAACEYKPAGVASLDLAATIVEIVDMAQPPLDLTVVADLAPRRCASPAPAAYLEFLAYTWTQIGGGPPQYASNSTPVSVRGDGAIVRSRTAPPTPDRMPCTFTERDVDSETCTALCCPGSLLSPAVYVDSRGWSLWTTGSCTFVIAGVQYTAAVNQISTSFAH